MCTAITFHTKDHYFGRNLDLEHSYGESIRFISVAKIQSMPITQSSEWLWLLTIIRYITMPQMKKG